MSNCFWAIEILHRCHWWPKQHTLSSSNSLTSCADNCVCLREPASFHTQHAFTHRTLTHNAFTNGKRSHTHTASFLNREAFTHNKLLHRESLTHSKLSHTASVYTQNTYAQCFYTWQAFTHAETFTQRRFYTQRSFYTQQAFTQNLLHTASFYRKKFLHREAFLYIVTTGIAAPKPDLDAKATKRRFWSTL